MPRTASPVRHNPAVEALIRIRRALIGLALVIVGGTVGYLLLGFGFLDALYQTVTTITTVGFREVRTLDAAGKVFTIVLILAGVGTALYTFGVLLDALVEGHLREYRKGRRMTRHIDSMTDHVIICGWGRVGRACAEYLHDTHRPFVVVDRDARRLENVTHPHVQGDVTDDAVLRQAGIDRAHALVAALDTDADNVYVTLSARAIRRELVIIARARNEDSKSKLLRAGADRAVNPQLLGGRRMAAFALQPHVAEFLDVVMHDESLDYRIEQVEVLPGSQLAGSDLAMAALPERTGVQLLAVRNGSHGEFVANPAPTTRLADHAILIVVGTDSQLSRLRALAMATA